MDLSDKYPEEEEFSCEELELWFYTNNQVKDKDKELFKVIFDGIRSASLNESLVRETLNEVRKRSIAGELAIAFIGLSEGVSEQTRSVDELLQQYHADEVTLDENPFVTDDLETLYEETVKTPGLRWRLSALNRTIGSLRRGDFGFVFARPETGKTTLLASEITNFANQTEQPILWFNNEEQGNKVMLRCYQAALGCTLTELMYDRSGNKERYFKETRGNIRLYDSASIHYRDVERLCKELRPALVVFDQVDKIKGFVNDREDLRLGAIYIWARELAKTYCPVIGICQAGGQAEGKKRLTMDDVSNAKTSKQAEADFIIGIGKSHNEDEEYTRYLSICKNKLQGDEDSDPSMRHSCVSVIIDPQRARYKDVMK